MIKTVIFDYDETLTKTMEARAIAYSDFAKSEYDQELSIEKVKQTFGKPYEQFIEILYGEVEDIETIIAKYQKFSENYPAIPYGGAIEVVNHLFSKYLVGIVSGVRRRGIQKDLETLGVEQKYLFHLQCGDDTTILKPDFRVFDPLILKLNMCRICPNQVVYVGNDLKDFEASTGAGFHFIGLANHTDPISKFVKVGASCITDFADLEAEISRIV